MRRVKDARTWMRCFRCGAITRLSPTPRCRRPGRYHPPTPRHHRNHLRRFNRRPLAHIPSGCSRQLRLAGLRGDRP
ncbi:putative transposase [Mycobacterium xenopi 4042]|uniref:Putative transposase n=1 Tax=Mycobacterium xenopi 4042 TaxID=1299334 RepID=X8AHV8_MYCXE|nr:putative transposase [Mycobacterium xenopi 4042]